MKPKVDESIVANINRKRRTIMVHSFIYYELSDNIISDAKWSKVAHELVRLQKEYPVESAAADYWSLFRDFDGSTGFHLTHEDWLESKAKLLLDIRDNGV